MNGKKGDIVRAWQNRKTSNKVVLKNFVKGEIIADNLNKDKGLVVIKILEGSVTIRHTYAGWSYTGPTYKTCEGFRMNGQNGCIIRKGEYFIAFRDGFEVIGKAESNMGTGADAPAMKITEMSANLRKINQNTLMCLLAK